MTEQPTPPASKSIAVARYDGPRTLGDLQAYALLLAFDTNPEGQYKQNNALPATFRGNPGAVAFAVEYAKALDVSPVTAIMGVHMIDGKLAASAGLISALVRRAGHKVRTWTEGSISEGTFKAFTSIIRSDDPEFEYRSEWDLPRAVRAKLMRHEGGRFVATKARSGWDNYPENMCKARTITEAARDAAEDAILGVHYTPEELGVELDEAGEPVYTVTTVAEHVPYRPPASGPPAEQKTPEADQETPKPEHVAEDPVQLADAARSKILAARSLEELTTIWSGPEIQAKTDRAGVLVCGDEAGQETTVLDLFRKAAAAIKADAPLVPDEDVDEARSRGELDEDIHDAELVPDANIKDLTRILANLRETNPTAHADVLRYLDHNGIDPSTDDVAAEVLEAIAVGDVFSDTTVRETLNETPLDLVTRILGASVIEETRTTQAEAHARELAENAREDAEAARREARAPSAGKSGERGAAARNEARRKIAEARKS